MNIPFRLNFCCCFFTFTHLLTIRACIMRTLLLSLRRVRFLLWVDVAADGVLGVCVCVCGSGLTAIQFVGAKKGPRKQWLENN